MSTVAATGAATTGAATGDEAATGAVMGAKEEGASEGFVVPIMGALVLAISMGALEGAADL